MQLQTLIAFAVCIAAMIVLTLAAPSPEKWDLPANAKVELHTSKPAAFAGGLVLAAVGVFYIIFW